jgi:hypothetical protein
MSIRLFKGNNVGLIRTSPFTRQGRGTYLVQRPDTRAAMSGSGAPDKCRIVPGMTNPVTGKVRLFRF